MSKNTRNKFMVGAVTAAMVATAVAPVAGAEAVAKPNAESLFSDVPASYTHFENINKAVELEFLSGYQDGTFKPYQSLTRANVVKALGKYILATEGKEITDYDLSKVTPFNDVPATHPDSELYNFSLLVKQAGIFTGSNNNLMPTNLIQRQQMAKVLVEAFDLKDLAGVESKVTDNDKAFDAATRNYINILSENGVTTESVFNPTGTTTRGQFASFMIRAFVAGGGVVTPAPGETPAVTSVQATNPTTVVINGSNLTELAQADVKVVGKTVTGFTPAANGNSTTLTVDTPFVPGQTYTVQVTIDGKVQNFTFTFAYSPSDAAIVTTTIDDDMDEQYITFSMNGALANLDYVKNVLGYTVEFQADAPVFEIANSTTDATAQTASRTSSTGEIAEGAVLINQDFDVQVLLTKDGVTTKSELANIRVVNMNSTPAIAQLELTNYGRTTAPTDNFVMRSNTLVTGETASVTGLFTATGNPIVTSGDFVTTSSNSGIASVDANGIITPRAPGTVIITATAGNQSYSVTLTVTNEGREFTSVATSLDSLKLGRDVTRAITVRAFDQYGDFSPIATADIEASATNGSDVTATYTNGVLSVNAGDNAGTYTVYLNDISSGELLKSIPVVVTAGNTPAVAQTRVELAPGEADSTVNIGETVAIDVNEYTVDLGYVGEVTTTPVVSANGTTATVGNYTVSLANPETAEFAVVGTQLVVRGLETGNVDVRIANNNVTLNSKLTVTVQDNAVRATDINWTSTGTIIAEEAVELEDVLNITEVTTDGADDIVNGVTLNTTTTAFVRVQENADGTNFIYLDVNDNGTYDTAATADDILLGSVTLAVVDLATARQAGTTFTTAAGDEGELVYTFNKANGDALESTVIDVLVPAAPVNTP